MSQQSTPPTARRDRPHAPGYGIKTGAGGLLDWRWVDERMSRSKNYWVCTTRPDGRPHAAPVWGVWLDGTLYFGSRRDSVKGCNLAHSPAVSVHLESGDESVIIEGTVQEVRDRSLLERIAAGYAAKYPDFEPTPDDLTGDAPTFAVRPALALAWDEKAFPETATRWKFEQASA